MSDVKPVASQPAYATKLAKVWANLPGWGGLAAVNHSTIGLRFMVTGLLFFLIGGVLAMLLRTQLALPEQDIVSAKAYSQLFTMHGSVMMFLFAIPVLEGLAIYLVPKMIGARDLVFPRISALGYYCYLFGGIIIMCSLLLGIAPDSGWFMYTPLSSIEFAPGPGSDFWLLGITFVEISAMAAGIELTVSILCTRARGMTLSRMPLFCWYILVMALMIVFGFPPLILASILLELERAAGMPFFTVAAGGDPLLWQHLFWLFGHPEVYIIFLPAAGIVSTLIPVFSGRPIVGYRWVVIAVILTGFISFGLWVHHMFTVGIPQLAQAFFSMASMLVAIPTAIQVFAWLATLWRGKVVFRLPMLWVSGFLVIFVCGGLTGVMLALVPFNWQVHDTHFVVAHMHYVLVGGMFFPLIAGLYYWLPLVSGRMPSAVIGRWGFWLTFGGFNLTFLLMHLTGLLGMPRRVYTYEAGLGWDGLNLLSSIGGFIMAIGVALVLLDLLLHFWFGRKASANPWQADTLEWALEMPPAQYNFASIPAVSGRQPLWQDSQLAQRIAAGQEGLANADSGLRETYGTSAVSAQLEKVLQLPGNSWWPLYSAITLAVVCISLLCRWYELALLAFVLTIILLLRWSWENGGHPTAAPLQPLADGPGRTLHTESELPLESRTLDGPGRWGMIVTLLANGALYMSLLFGWFYLWTAAPQWSAPDNGPLPLWLLLLAGVPACVAVWLFQRLCQRLAGRDAQQLQRQLWLSAGFGLLHFSLLLALFMIAPLDYTASAHDAVLLVIMFYLLGHAGLAVVVTALQALRVARGYVSASLPYEPQVIKPLWFYYLAVYWLSVALFFMLPLGWGSR